MLCNRCGGLCRGESDCTGTYATCWQCGASSLLDGDEELSLWNEATPWLGPSGPLSLEIDAGKWRIGGLVHKAQSSG